MIGNDLHTSEIRPAYIRRRLSTMLLICMLLVTRDARNEHGLMTLARACSHVMVWSVRSPQVMMAIYKRLFDFEY